MKEESMTYQQFREDVHENAKIILKESGIGFNNKETIIHIHSSDKIFAKAKPTADDQYTIYISEGLLRSIFNHVDQKVRPLYQVIIDEVHISEELFIRFVCGIASDMAFWHEFAHLSGGHFDFLSSKGVPISEESINENQLKYRRLVETDADIYGASFLFARLLSMRQSFSDEVLATCYSLGIRTLFEVLYSSSEDDYHSQNKHPHSLSRTYIATKNGLNPRFTAHIGHGSFSYFQKLVSESIKELWATEGFSSVHDTLISRQGSIDQSNWNSLKQEIDPFRKIKIYKPPLIHRCINIYRRMKALLSTKWFKK